MTLREVSKSITARRNKIIIHLLFNRHKTVKEVAHKMDLTPANVYQIQHRYRM
jgi:DNA-directed RNA polymerase specialized sigma subunit